MNYQCCFHKCLCSKHGPYDLDNFGLQVQNFQKFKKFHKLHESIGLAIVVCENASDPSRISSDGHKFFLQNFHGNSRELLKFYKKVSSTF